MRPFSQWCLLLALWAIVLIALLLGSPVHAQIATGTSASSSSTTTTTTTTAQSAAPQIVQLPTAAYQTPLAAPLPSPCPAPSFGAPLGYSRGFSASYGRSSGVPFRGAYHHAHARFAAPVQQIIVKVPPPVRVPVPVAVPRRQVFKTKTVAKAPPVALPRRQVVKSKEVVRFR